MRPLPKSLTGRLLVTAGLATTFALLFAAFAIGQVLEHFVMHGLDERLDAQIALVGRTLKPDGTVSSTLAVDVPPFDTPGSGWAWEVIAPNRMLRSSSLGSNDLPLPPAWNRPPREDRGPRQHHDDWEAHDHPRPLDGTDQEGRPLHYRFVTIVTTAGPVTIVAAAPRGIVDRPWRAAMVPLLISLFLLGGLLALALLLQLRIGLRPLNRLTALLGDVREGRLHHIDVDEPTELLPLVDELNALIGANDQALARARGHVANLAHGLKTPLATLRLDLTNPKIDPDGHLAAQVERMEGQIRHHLGRARAAEPNGLTSGIVALGTCIGDLAEAMARIHAERSIVARIYVPDSAAVRCDPQDLDELLGNLLDNAWRWACSTVRIAAEEAERHMLVTIADDGPGMTERDIEALSSNGRRLDEQRGLRGFGLVISRELAELHGGSLALVRSDQGGLEARVYLPRR